MHIRIKVCVVCMCVYVCVGGVGVVCVGVSGCLCVVCVCVYACARVCMKSVMLHCMLHVL